MAAMATPRIVEHRGVVEQICARLLEGPADAPTYLLLFRRTEERFVHRVAPAVAAPAHAGKKSVADAEAVPVVAAVLRPQVRVSRDTFLWSPHPNGNCQRSDDQIAGHPRQHRPIRDLPRVQVQHDRQVEPPLPLAGVLYVG